MQIHFEILSPKNLKKEMNQNFSSPFANPSGSTTSATGANSMNMNASIGNTSLSGISMNGMAGINMGNNQYQQQMFYQQQMNTTIPSRMSPLIGSNPMMNIVNSNRSLGLPSQIQNNNFVGGSVNVGLQNINQQGQMNQMGQMPLNMNNFQMGYNQVNPSFTQNFNPSMVSSPMINNQSMNMASNMNSIQSQQRLGGSNLNPIGNPQLQSQQTQNRPNIFRTLDGTMHQRLNERPSFDLVLNRYLEQRGISPSQIPTFIDCFVLFHTVLQHGGYEKVILTKR